MIVYSMMIPVGGTRGIEFWKVARKTLEDTRCSWLITKARSY